MENRSVFILIVLLVIFDFFAINFAYRIVYLTDIINQSNFNSTNNLLHLIIIKTSWYLAAILLKTYTYNNIQSSESLYKKSAYTFVLYVALLVLALNLFRVDFFNINMAYFLAIQFASVSIVRFIIILLESQFLKMFYFKKNIAIIGDRNLSLSLEKYFLENKLSFNLTANFSDTFSSVNIPGSNKLSELKDSINSAIKNKLDEVYITYFPEQSAALDEVITLAEKNCVRVKFVTSFIKFKHEEETFINSNYRLSDYYNGIPILVQRNEPLALIRNRVIKRAFDIAFSLAVIIFILSWLLPLMILLIRLESKGAAVFMQLRSGRDNEPFYCYKFRSMRLNANSNNLQATKNDPRVTKLGAFMRKTSIDELPQFFNVLMGDMSIVGPRPHMLKHTEEYSEIIDQYMVRQFLKPGITGWAQINGFRGETKHHHQMLNRVKHDIWYMENWSLLKDIKIIIMTVVNAVRGEENAF